MASITCTIIAGALSQCLTLAQGAPDAEVISVKAYERGHMVEYGSDDWFVRGFYNAEDQGFENVMHYDGKQYRPITVQQRAYMLSILREAEVIKPYGADHE